MSDNDNDDEPAGMPRPARSPGREPLAKPLARRFYTTAGVEETATGFRIVLDGRPVRTPAKRELAVPTRALAQAIADEWSAQIGSIDPDTMPLTRIVNSAIDAVADSMAAVAADVEAFAGNDLLCYRATDPAGLVQRQHAHWDPVLGWAASDLGVRLATRSGVMPLAQDPAAIAAAGRAVARLDPLRLAALHVMTTLTGSALLALAHLRGRLTAEQAWAAAHVDETWQIEHWGQDAEAEARSAKRRRDFEAASRLVALLDG